MIASPYDELDYDYAASVAQKALHCMAAEHVPATPDNLASGSSIRWEFQAICSAPSIF
jgi:hypothetical protein